MKQTRERIKDVALVTVIVAALLVTFPLLGIAAFALRFVLVAAVIVAVVGSATVYVTSPAFRDRVRAWMEPEVLYKGLRQATDVGFHSGHVWARFSRDTAAVGADDLVQTVLGPVSSVDLPRPGDHVTAGGRLFSLKRNGRQLDLPSPISGTVVESNGALLLDPDPVNREPYGDGWVARIRPDQPKETRKPLRWGFKARAWYQGEVDRLVSTLTGPEAHYALPDGGVFVTDLYRQIDDEAWNRLRSEFFQVPTESY